MKQQLQLSFIAAVEIKQSAVKPSQSKRQRVYGGSRSPSAIFRHENRDVAHSKRQRVHGDHHGAGFVCTDGPLAFVLATLGGVSSRVRQNTSSLTCSKYDISSHLG